MTLTVREVCQLLRVSEHTCLHWLHTGQLAGINVGRTPGKKRARWRVTERALEAFEMARTQAPPMPRLRRRRGTADTIPDRY